MAGTCATTAAVAVADLSDTVATTAAVAVAGSGTVATTADLDSICF